VCLGSGGSGEAFQVFNEGPLWAFVGLEIDAETTLRLEGDFAGFAAVLVLKS